MTVDRKNHKDEGEEEKKQEEVETPEPGTPWVGKYTTVRNKQTRARDLVCSLLKKMMNGVPCMCF
jgi:hypothetical protein